MKNDRRQKRLLKKEGKENENNVNESRRDDDRRSHGSYGCGRVYPLALDLLIPRIAADPVHADASVCAQLDRSSLGGAHRLLD